jgi:hypothetical protein
VFQSVTRFVRNGTWNDRCLPGVGDSPWQVPASGALPHRDASPTPKPRSRETCAPSLPRPSRVRPWPVPSPIGRDFRKRHVGDLKRYVLEVKARFDPSSPGRKADQLAKDIAFHLLDVRAAETQAERVLRDSASASPHFHRLNVDLVDEDNTLETKVERLRRDHGAHRASFRLTLQTD